MTAAPHNAAKAPAAAAVAAPVLNIVGLTVFKFHDGLLPKPGAHPEHSQSI